MERIPPHPPRGGGGGPPPGLGGGGGGGGRVVLYHIDLVRHEPPPGRLRRPISPFRGRDGQLLWPFFDSEGKRLEIGLEARVRAVLPLSLQPPSSPMPEPRGLGQSPLP